MDGPPPAEDSEPGSDRRQRRCRAGILGPRRAFLVGSAWVDAARKRRREVPCSGLASLRSAERLIGSRGLGETRGVKALLGWTIVAVTAVFVLFNLDRARVWFFGIRVEMPIALVVIVASALGGLATYAFTSLKKPRP